jgi:hypothetical protein
MTAVTAVRAKLVVRWTRVRAPHSVVAVLQCVTLWVGNRLGPVERACLRSVLRQGHDLALYCYGEVEGIPAGVEVRHAGDVLPKSAVFRHRSGSYAFFADWFRYELMRRGAGTWVDTDVYLIAPLDPEPRYYFGEQGQGVLNNAVLRLPADSPLLGDLLVPFEGKTPRWLRGRDSLAARLRKWSSGRANPALLPWGTTGPHALTALAKEHGLMAEALPPSVLYPVPWTRAEWIRDPTLRIEDVISPDTLAVHLWNERVKEFKDKPAPEGSFLHRLQDEGC